MAALALLRTPGVLFPRGDKLGGVSEVLWFVVLSVMVLRVL
jgi:hypothetical protein